MTAALADFATSWEGKAYAVICERYGVDPGAIFSDDVVAFQARAAFMVAGRRREEPQAEEPQDDWAREGARNRAAWLAGASVSQHEYPQERAAEDDDRGENEVAGIPGAVRTLGDESHERRLAGV